MNLAIKRVMCELKNRDFEELLEQKRAYLKGYYKVLEKLKADKNTKKIPTWELSISEMKKEIQALESLKQ